MMDSFTVEYKKVSDVLRPPILFGGFFIFLLRGIGAHICRLGARCLLKYKKGVKVPR